MKNKKHILLSFLLMLFLTATVSAAEEHSHSLSESGEALLWNGVSAANEITAEGNYYLEEDITLSADLVIGQSVNLCLNGHKLDVSDMGGIKQVKVSEGGTLNICDCSGDNSGIITSARDTSTIFNKGTVNLYSGSLGRTVEDTSRIVDNKAGAVMNMYGGKIYGTTIAVKTEGLFNVYGGSISGDCGAFQIEGGETLITENAEVDCTGADWATISLYGGTLNISGGTIKNSGGSTAIQLPYGKSCMNISDGTITTSGEANCINAASADADICISGGTIKNNYGSVSYVSGYGDFYGWGINANAFKSFTLGGNLNIDTIYLYGTQKIKISDSGLQNETPIGIYCRSYPMAFTESNGVDNSGRFVCKAPNSAYILYNNSDNQVVFAMRQAIGGRVTISGKPNVNEVLTAAYTPADENETYTCQWYCENEKLEGETQWTYTVKPENINKKIKFVVTGTGFYRDTKSAEMTIVKTAVQYTPPIAKRFEFNGEEQELVQAGECQGGVMKYSFSETGEFSEEIPKAVNVGWYVVFYRAFGDACHSDGAVGSVMARILPKQISNTIVLTTPVRNATPQTEITGDGYTATVVWSPEVTDKFKSSTEYTATITITVDENHTIGEIAENGYVVEGAKSVTNAANSNEITVAFARTGSSGGGGGGATTTTYTVKFETDGADEIKDVKVTKNKTVAEPTEPTKDGYTFVGWFTDEELTLVYDFETKVTKSFTLYAKWEKVDDDKKDETDDKTDTPVWENPFEDVENSDWYYADVEYAAQNGLFNGTSETTFAPNGIITRAMMVTVLYRNEGEPEVTGETTFEDVDSNAYYAKAVVWGQQNGIIKGYSETEFAPDQNITREQIAAIMHRYATYKGVAPTGAWANRLEYADLAEIADYATEGVMYCTKDGLMKGKGNDMFCPKDNATRAEIAAIIHRFIEANK